jgi:catechol 2,3-dioxygenase
VPHIPFARSAFIAIGIILGTRVELANSGARLIMQSDWETITWTENERKKGQAWGLKTIETFHTHGTPPIS